ncbi:MAG: tetratricopeptide repeat protein [Polyangiales bacterium]
MPSPSLRAIIALVAASSSLVVARSDAQAQSAATTVSALTEEQRAEARAAQRRGNELFARNNYEAALTEFLRVYQVAQGRPNAFIYLLNIARCYERLFRYDQAIQYFQRYLERAPADDADRPSAQATITALEGLLATIEVQSNVADAQVWVDDRQVADRAGVVRVPGGVHVVELRARGYAPSRQQVQLPARTTQTLSFRLERLNVRRGVHPAFFGTVTAVGAAAAIAGIAFGARAVTLRAEVDRLAGGAATASAVGQDQKDQIRVASVVADLMFSVTAAAAVGATLLAFATEWRRPAELDGARSRRASRWRVVPLVDASALGIVVGGAL